MRGDLINILCLEYFIIKTARPATPNRSRSTRPGEEIEFFTPAIETVRTTARYCIQLFRNVTLSSCSRCFQQDNSSPIVPVRVGESFRNYRCLLVACLPRHYETDNWHVTTQRLPQVGYHYRKLSTLRMGKVWTINKTTALSGIVRLLECTAGVGVLHLRRNQRTTTVPAMWCGHYGPRSVSVRHQRRWTNHFTRANLTNTSAVMGDSNCPIVSGVYTAEINCFDSDAYGMQLIVLSNVSAGWQAQSEESASPNRQINKTKTLAGDLRACATVRWIRIDLSRQCDLEVGRADFGDPHRGRS